MNPKRDNMALGERLVNSPLAAKGFLSYRYKGRLGWIMIGARDNAEALNEAKRSLEKGATVTLANLEKWDGKAYIAA